MADAKMVYVDLYGDEVAENDPAVQTQYHPDELKALRKGGFFPKRAHDEGSDPENAADPVVGGVPTPDGDVEQPAKPAHAKK